MQLLLGTVLGCKLLRCCQCRRFDAIAFRAELKDIIRVAGMEGIPLLLFLEERHLGHDPGECVVDSGEGIALA